MLLQPRDHASRHYRELGRKGRAADAARVSDRRCRHLPAGDQRYDRYLAYRQSGYLFRADQHVLQRHRSVGAADAFRPRRAADGRERLGVFRHVLSGLVLGAGDAHSRDDTYRDDGDRDDAVLFCRPRERIHLPQPPELLEPPEPRHDKRDRQRHRRQPDAVRAISFLDAARQQ